MATTKKTTAKSSAKKAAPKHIGIVANDPWLEPYEDAIRGRHDHAVWMENELTNQGKMSLSDFANGHEYYGLHRDDKGKWIFREWAPNATAIYLISTVGRKAISLQQSVSRTQATGN